MINAIICIMFLTVINVGSIMTKENILSPQEINKQKAAISLSIDKDAMVKKRTLKNGMVVLVRKSHTIPKVSIQLWYYVGSADEGEGEKGIAHLIEHMIFKGTSLLSESDINTITHMLSGSCNAFTSYDYTGYLFNMPTHHWKEVLPIMADCMLNCSFKEDMLSSEMKAVIQELKMYKDSYLRSLADEMIGTIFADHPYHHPIIGYKQDLWSVSSNDLKAFYKKHYHPNNATLVIVGDVDEEEAFALAEKQFGSIPADKNYKKKEHYFNQDIIAKTVTLYRDIQQPTVAFSFVVPGTRAKKDHALYLLEWILAKGKSSRLHKKLVDELQLVTSIEASAEELFDYGLFFIVCEPKNMSDLPRIEQCIHDTIADIVRNGVHDEELIRAVKQTQMQLYSILENTEQQAYQIGKYYLATNDENYIFNYMNKTNKEFKKDVESILINYFRPAVMHKGMILPLPEEEKETWVKLQQVSDEEDARILSARVRETEVEAPKFAKTMQIKKSTTFAFPKAQTCTLKNGLKALYYNNKNTPKINIHLSLKAQDYYDPENMQGLYSFLAAMLTEGTRNYTAEQLAHAIESRGMSFYAYPGGVSMSMLTEDLPFGLSILTEVLTAATFNEKNIEKVRSQLIAQLKNFWDEPWSFAKQLVREKIYKDHPYSKNSLGTLESLKHIKKADLVEFYHTYIVPFGAKIALVGNLGNYDIKTMLESTLGKWHGNEIEAITFPALENISPSIINYPINRDQIVLFFAGLSVDRKDLDYDKLRLFDQIFGSGELGSMSSRLFDLREQSGLFYTINGSLIVGADEQPGMVLVKTIVSCDRLQEAEKAIANTIDTAIDTVTDQELTEAKNAMINALVDYFASNSGIANVFLFLDRYDFPSNYFDNRAAELAKITKEEMERAVRKVLKSDKLLRLRVGRVEKDEKTTEEK